ncbi:hypothetical protein EDC04DRAFT_2604339 [Pisolithus marmoratus]|nr:hypothetical protein EDC04DRAFT_2604339 [Pisolithus marmoratus]
MHGNQNSVLIALWVCPGILSCSGGHLVHASGSGPASSAASSMFAHSLGHSGSSFPTSTTGRCQVPSFGLGAVIWAVYEALFFPSWDFWCQNLTIAILKIEVPILGHVLQAVKDALVMFQTPVGYLLSLLCLWLQGPNSHSWSNSHHDL